MCIDSSVLPQSLVHQVPRLQAFPKGTDIGIPERSGATDVHALEIFYELLDQTHLEKAKCLEETSAASEKLP